MEVQPVARVVGGRPVPEDDHWGGAECVIRLVDELDPECLVGLEEFSHVEVVFVFDRAVEFAGSRHPRGNTAWPRVGIFAQRGKDRVNRIGVSRARVLGVSGREVRVAGLDAIDGTPVLDLKPWFEAFGPQGPTHEPSWVGELTAAYWD